MASGQFRSALYANFPGPGLAVPNDVWFATDLGQTFWADNQGNLHQLLAQSPFNVSGPAGPAGQKGDPGESFLGTCAFLGTWVPNVEFQPGSIVTWQGFAYLLKQFLSIGDNTMSPNGNPFWQVLASVNTSRSSELVVMVDGAAVLPTLGTKGFISVPYNCTITGWTILANASGSCEFDVKYSTLANFPSTVSIVNGSNPALSSAQSADGSVSTWTQLSLNVSDVIEVALLSCSGAITFLTLAIQTTAQN